MPFFIAISLIAETGGLVKMNRSISASTKNTSYNPFLPLYPVKLHASQPFSFTCATLIFSKFGSTMFLGTLFSPFLTSAKSLVDGVDSVEHSLQAFLTNRWAMTIFSAGAMLEGWVSKSTNLGIVPAASLVCNVDNTKWPVRAACKAILAVSASLISPTKITSGSWRTMLLKPSEKVYPLSAITSVLPATVCDFSGDTWVWEIPLI